MTEKEIKQLRRDNPRFNKDKPLTELQKRLHRELDCREMINSCLCYWDKFFDWRYELKYINELWEKRVIELYYEQLKDFEKSTVIRWVFTDEEGCTYNSIKWRDE